MQQPTATLIVAIVGIAGTLIASVVPQLMSRSSQERQWSREKKTQEYRELLDALTTAYLEAMEVSRLAAMGFMHESDDEIEPSEAQFLVWKMLHNRLFTAVELKREKVSDRWLTAINTYQRRGGIEPFVKRFESISATIVWLSTGVGQRPRDL